MLSASRVLVLIMLTILVLIIQIITHRLAIAGFLAFLLLDIHAEPQQPRVLVFTVYPVILFAVNLLDQNDKALLLAISVVNDGSFWQSDIDCVDVFVDCLKQLVNVKTDLILDVYFFILS